MSSSTVFPRLFKHRGLVSGALILPGLAFWSFATPRIMEGTWTDDTLDACAWLLLAAGILARLWATLYIGGRKGSTMVTDGPYAMSRHPLYVGSFLVGAALVFFLKSVIVLVAVGLVALLYVVVVIPSEERHLLGCFGNAYTMYCQHTRRLVPCVHVGRPGVIEVKIGAFLREAARGMGFIFVAIAVELLAHLRELSWWPHWFRFP